MITQREVKLYSCSCTICQRSLYLTIDRGSSRRRKLSVVPAPQGAGLYCPLCLPSLVFFRKEVFQPHLPVRLPCYDLAPITGFALGRSLRLRTSGAPGFHGLTGGVYKARERIHRAMADARLLANPA